MCRVFALVIYHFDDYLQIRIIDLFNLGDDKQFYFEMKNDCAPIANTDQFKEFINVCITFYAIE